MKMEELKDLSMQELTDKLEDTRNEMSKARFDHAITPLEDPMSLRRMRKEVARMLTELGMRAKATNEQA